MFDPVHKNIRLELIPKRPVDFESVEQVEFIKEKQMLIYFDITSELISNDVINKSIYRYKTKEYLVSEAEKEKPIEQTVSDGMTAKIDPIMQFFSFKHLPPPLQAISRPFFEIADCVHTELPDNPERAECLRKILEAKDCAVRAFIFGKIS